ncbi:bifunctional 3'-5' exonuclease/DNA polymerase [Microbacterium sp. NC79]|uniref:bifunctional 3'-5' exonuclease/DNA polymerase n=1 Tax=Microbacterium sp. NC79 TaxID=2851009 RepID=UPI00349F61F3
MATLIGANGEEHTAHLSANDWPAWVREHEHATPRWVFNDTALVYPALLNAGVRVARAHDLRLCHAILRDSALVAAGDELRRAVAWDVSPAPEPPERPVEALFDFASTGPRQVPGDPQEIRAEFDRQRAILNAADGRLRLLTVAESTGALIAAEMRSAGLPWDVAAHEKMLTDTLGERPAAGGAPSIMLQRAEEVRQLLGDMTVSLDSQPKLLRALHRAGILVESTSKWELEEQKHPAIEPLLEYKKLSRLYSANAWAWLDEWVQGGRFRPVYVPGGVVTGRWASSGGGALQIPRALRTAVRAAPGWRLIIADVAQLEPRVLAAMSGDLAMADAARGHDLYSGLVDRGIVATRQEAKIAVLGAMYGSTTGEAGRLVPRLRRAFPLAMAKVDHAAQTGEDGGTVTTLLGRSSPQVSADWMTVQRAATDVDADPGAEQRARRSARDRGRFTRNFIVQGTAAEWALAWLAEIRRGLVALGETSGPATEPSGATFARVPHLAFFLHDEVILHVPEDLAEASAQVVRDAADRAAALLFGTFPLDFPLDLKIAENAGK